MSTVIETKNYKVLAPFRYPSAQGVRWYVLGEDIPLPAHAAEALIRQLKIEVEE